MTKRDVAEKPCSHCKQIKVAGEFYGDPRATTGLASRCKVCHRLMCGRSKTYVQRVQDRLYQKQYYALHREYYQNYRALHREEYNAKKRQKLGSTHAS